MLQNQSADNKPATNPTRIVEGEATAAEPEFHLLESVSRIALGTLLEGGEQFRNYLKQREADLLDQANVAASQPDESVVDQMRYLLIGGLFDIQRKTRQRVERNVERVNRLGEAIDANLRPLRERIIRSWWVETGMILVSAEIERLVREGRLQEENARRLTRGMLTGGIDDIVQYLSDNEHVDALVNAQVNQLENNIHVEKLSQNIVQHFVDHPEPVRKLVQNQSASLTDELGEEMRERAVTLDMLAETLVRRFLRRPPRTEVEEPPEAVKARARHLHPDDHLP